MKRAKVLHLLSSNRFSGAENVVFQIIEMIKDEPDIEMVYCSRDGQIREALNEQNIQFAAINDITVSEVKRVIYQHRPNLIHAHDMRASYIASKACGQVPIISHIHNNNFNSRIFSIKTIAYLLAGFKAKHIIWVSQSSYDGYLFHRFFKKKSTTLYNIIDVNALYKKMKTDVKMYDYDVVYVGRLTYQKNPQRLMRVISIIVEKLPNVKIAIIGTGELEEDMKILCNELKLNCNVSFLGFQSNPLKIMYDSKVMMMTSRWEGTPICALEAMALGVPIVCTPTDGLIELVEDDKNGYLSDDNDILAHKVSDIILHPELHRRLSEYTEVKSQLINSVAPYKQKIMSLYEREINV